MTTRSRWTPLELVRWTTDYFRRHAVSTPRLDAEVLLAHVLDVGRIDLYLRFEEAVADSDRERYRELVQRRAQGGEPVAHLTGVREFWSKPFRVSPDVLTPRPETEGVVEAVLKLAPSRVVDVGTGCGAIACALALELPQARVLALDRCRAALRIARENVESLGLSGRVGLAGGDWLSAFRGQWDVICGNLPYIPTGELGSLPREVRHEPRLALDGGPDGLDPIRALVRGAPARLRRPGAIVLEVGEGQAASVEAILREAEASRTEVRKDLSGLERVIIGRFEES